MLYALVNSLQLLEVELLVADQLNAGPTSVPISWLLPLS